MNLPPKVQAKYDATAFHLDLAASVNHKDSLVITFASSHSNLNGEFPRDMALGNTLGGDGVNQKVCTRSWYGKRL